MSAVTRRQAMSATAAAVSSVWLPAAVSTATSADSQPTTVRREQRIRKAVKLRMVQDDRPLVEKFRLLKRLGFDGVEINGPASLTREEIVAARDQSDLPVHGVVSFVHWKQPLSSADPEVRAQGLEGLTRAIGDAQAYGASAVLLVPAVVDKQTSYQDAYHRSQAEIRKAIPIATEANVMILLENVWNNFLLSPVEMARYIDELESPFVGSYFDVGNVVRFGWPEHWIRTLGNRIVKLDIKEYSRELQNTAGPRAGFKVEIGEGDCDWPDVMKALRDIDFRGWATAEVPGGDEARLADIAARMDRVLEISA